MNLSTLNLFGNSSSAQPVNWQEEPNTRGTSSIISTCLITLSLCVWTALHLNIPEHPHKTGQIWQKIGWLILGLLAPELIVYIAFEQRRVALCLTKEMRDILGDTSEHKWWEQLCFCKRKKVSQNDDETKPQAHKYRWTHVHSFYTLMGGFAFDTSKANPNFLPNNRSHLTLRPRGLKYIAEHAPFLIPDLSKDKIQDKSKADGLAKLFVCLQALWFCLQCIVRMAQKQAISFLELNTFGHSICTLLIYGLWWHKPLNIESPSVLVGENAWEICALMCVTSTGDSPINLMISEAFFRRIFRFESHSYMEVELNRGQKFGGRNITRWFDVIDGTHLAKLN